MIYLNSKMTKIFLIIGLFLLFTNCNNKNTYLSEDNSLSNIEDSSLIEIFKYPGVVIVIPDSIEYLKRNILIRDSIGILCNQLYFDDNEKIVKFQQNKTTIREYYPDYSVIVFDGYPLENGLYKVIINNSINFLEHVEGFTIFEKWEDHIQRTFISTCKSNPLREFPSDTSKIISNVDYENSHFTVLKVTEDWIYVECNINCDGCPSGKITSGWTRWKKDNKLVVKLSYTC